MGMNFALDIKVARRRSGLSQADVAHLLGVHRTRVSKLERGRYTPSANELASLSLIYGRRFPDLGNSTMPEICRALSERLATLPNRSDYASGLTNKAHTLNALAERLEASSNAVYEH